MTLGRFPRNKGNKIGHGRDNFLDVVCPRCSAAVGVKCPGGWGFCYPRRSVAERARAGVTTMPDTLVTSAIATHSYGAHRARTLTKRARILKKTT